MHFSWHICHIFKFQIFFEFIPTLILLNGGVCIDPSSYPINPSKKAPFFFFLKYKSSNTTKCQKLCGKISYNWIKCIITSYLTTSVIRIKYICRYRMNNLEFSTWLIKYLVFLYWKINYLPRIKCWIKSTEFLGILKWPLWTKACSFWCHTDPPCLAKYPIITLVESFHWISPPKLYMRTTYIIGPPRSSKIVIQSMPEMSLIGDWHHFSVRLSKEGAIPIAEQGVVVLFFRTCSRSKNRIVRRLVGYFFVTAYNCLICIVSSLYNRVWCGKIRLHAQNLKPKQTMVVLFQKNLLSSAKKSGGWFEKYRRS